MGAVEKQALLSTTLGCVADFQNGGAWKENEYVDSGVPVTRVTNCQSGTVDLSGCKYLSFSSAKKYERYRLIKGDLIVATVGSHPTQPGSVVGRTSTVPESASGSLLNQNAVRLRAKADLLDQRYLTYLASSKEFRDYIIAHARGAASQVRMSIELLRDMPLLLPPLSTQQLVASLLSAYDDLIESNTRRIEILEEMTRRLYEEWFVQFRFPGHDKVEFKESLPSGWAWVTIEDAADNFDRLRRPLSKMQRAGRSGSYPYYGAAKVFDYIDDYLFDGRYLLMAEDGSVITPEGHPVLQITHGKFWVNNHTHILKGRSPFSTELIYLALSSYKISGHITGAAQPKITQANMNRIPVLRATHDVHASFNALIGPIFDLIEMLERKNANLRAQRDLLLPKLISGEIDVSDIPMPT